MNKTHITEVHSYFDTDKGFFQDHPGWHKVDLSVKSPQEHLEIVKWMHDNIDNIERHCRWAWFTNVGAHRGQCIYKFRYERDYIFFKLRWS